MKKERNKTITPKIRKYVYVINYSFWLNKGTALLLSSFTD